MRLRNTVGNGGGAFADPHRLHPDRLWAGNILARRVTDKKNFIGVEPKHLEYPPINARIGFAQTDFRRDYDRLEQIGDAAVEQDLAAALRVIEIGKQSKAVMLRHSANRIRAFRRRPRHRTHRIHMYPGEIVSEQVNLVLGMRHPL